MKENDFAIGISKVVLTAFMKFSEQTQFWCFVRHKKQQYVIELVISGQFMTWIMDNVPDKQRWFLVPLLQGKMKIMRAKPI